MLDICQITDAHRQKTTIENQILHFCYSLETCFGENIQPFC